MWGVHKIGLNDWVVGRVSFWGGLPLRHTVLSTPLNEFLNETLSRGANLYSVYFHMYYKDSSCTGFHKYRYNRTVVLMQFCTF